ncbi:MAG: DUF1631 family protein, partial [Pseudomonadales bacterium]|nr:DUF1631 family protein [Pseudomonadales bacterium]
QVIWDQTIEDRLIKRCLKLAADLPSSLQAELRFNIRILSSFPKLSQLDKSFSLALMPMRLFLLAYATLGTQFWLEKHPIKQLFDLLYFSALGWQSDFLKHSDGFVTLLGDCVEAVGEIAPTDISSLQRLLLHTQTQISNFTKRFVMLSHRLVESESGLLKAQQVSYDITAFFTTLLTDKQLPVIVADFIQCELLIEIKLLLMREGVDAAVWLRWKKLLNILVANYQVQSAANVKTRPLVSKLPAEVRAAFIAMDFDMGAAENFCNQLDYDFAVIASGKPANDLKDVTLHYAFEEALSPQAQVSSALLAQVSSLSVGRWFLVRAEDGGFSRVQLSLKLEYFDQLLFTNVIGQKAFSKTLADFAYLLSAKMVRILRDSPVLEVMFVTTLDYCLEDFHVLHKEKEVQRQGILLRRQQQAEIEAQKLAAAKALDEANLFRARQDAEKQRLETEKVVGGLRRQARLNFDTLSLGSWIEVLNEDSGKYFRAKLAVKFNATGRFVFVDQDGATVIESQRDPLIDKVMDKKIRLLLDDETFAERLNKVVLTGRNT